MDVSFNIIDEIVKCSYCVREIYIAMVINGTNHTIGISAICPECVEKRKNLLGEKG